MESWEGFGYWLCGCKLTYPKERKVGVPWMACETRNAHLEPHGAWVEHGPVPSCSRGSPTGGLCRWESMGRNPTGIAVCSTNNQNKDLCIDRNTVKQLSFPINPNY